jgi:hypothetical protein
MTFLGCDDTATDCHYLATSQQRWTSIELCDAVSEKELERFANASYPVVVAVCQTPGEQTPQTAGNAPATQPPAATAPAGTEEPPAQVTQKEEESLTKQAISRVSRILPSTEGVKHLLGTPVRMVENSYSWIAKRFEK